MTREEILKTAEKHGLSQYGIFDVKGLAFRPEVRDMCAAGRCGQYGHSWACPPAIASLEEITEKAAKYSWGLLVQETGQMEDPYDVDVMLGTEVILKKKFLAFVDELTDEARLDCLPMGAGTCTRCKECTYPDAPCRFPEKVYPSMEAYGLVVSDTCELASIPYYYGPNTITYSCCILFR